MNAMGRRWGYWIGGFPGLRGCPILIISILLGWRRLFGFEGGVHQCFLMLKRLGLRAYHVAASLSVICDIRG